MDKQALIKQLNGLAPQDKLKFMEATLLAYPDFAHFVMMLTRWHIARNNFDKARELVSARLKTGHARPVLIVAAELEIKAKEFTTAYHHIERLIQKNSKDLQGYYLLGKLSHAEGRKEQAIINFKQAIGINKSGVGPVCELVDLFVKDERYLEANLVLEEAIQATPDSFFFLMRKGKIALLQKEYDNARAIYSLAIDQNKGNAHAANAAFQLSFVQEDPSNIEAIILQLKEFISKYPNHAGLRQRLANHLIIKKDYEEAHVQVDSILQMDKQHLIAQEIKATIFFRQDKLEESLKLIDIVLTKKPDSIHSLNLKANVLNQKEGCESEAFNAYQNMIALHPRNARGYAGCAQFLYLQGGIKEAFILLGKGLEQIPNSKPILEKLTQLSLAVGKYEYALDLAEKQIKSDPTNPKVQLAKARIQERMGDFEEMEKTTEVLRNLEGIGSVWSLRADKLIADTAFLNYDYNKAEFIFRKLVTTNELPNFERNRLAILLMLRGDVQGAIEQLKIATQEVEEKHTNGKVLIPLIGHTSRIINEFRIDPRMLDKVITARGFKGLQRIKSLAELRIQSPSYFGSALYLANELRSQGLLDKISLSLETQKGQETIPKTIIQYWDETLVPQEIQDVMKSWRLMNPGYDYKLFSRQTAYFFIKKHFGKKETKAFENCEHPAMQADFFRLAYLSKMGGFYSDADDKCIRSMEHLVDSGAEIVLKMGDFGCFSNNFLACAPGNPIITYAFEKAVENMNTYFNEGPWFRLGPGHLTSCVTYQLAKYVGLENYNEWPRLLSMGPVQTRKTISQHLGLSYKRTEKSWFIAEYKRQVSNTKAS